MWCCLAWSVPSWAVCFSPEAKRNNQLADSVNKTLTLVFCIDSAHYALPLDSIRAIYAWGSMSEYKDKADNCRMTQMSEDSCFYLTFTYDQIARPGDSGQPEFEFYVEKIDSTTGYYTPDTTGPCGVDHRLLFYNGITPVLIVLPGGPTWMTTNLDSLYARSLVARQVKPVSEFNLSDSVDQHRISNFRLVPATRHLYRSYHPYYPTLRSSDTEVERLHWVAELATQAGIKSDISLTSSMEHTQGQPYVCSGDTHIITIPPYFQTMIDNGHVGYIPVSASQCYFHPEDEGFANVMQQVVEFIIDERHPLPMQIHCAIGADRTGVVCAVISALCGASWSTIQADYAATSDMQVQTYRHPNRLRYMFKQLTQLDVDNCTSAQLAAAIREHLVVKMQVLTNEQIDRMVKRLNEESTAIEDAMAEQGAGNERYDVLGRKVDQGYHGIVVDNGRLILRP